MHKRIPLNCKTVEQAVEKIVQHLDKNIVLATPLGLGKPNQLINALYQRAKSDPSISLKIITALSLSVPKPSSELEKRFAEPFLERVYSGYVELDYVSDLKAQTLPDNIEVLEFYMQAGKYLSNATAQQKYISSNYTHVARDILSHGVNLIVQLVAHDAEHSTQHLSLSCNPDVSLDLAKYLEIRKQRASVLVVAQTHSKLPYMQQDAEVERNFFDIIVDNRAYDTTLFSVPNTTVSLTDHLIGLHASTLIKDGGTLQIGIGAMADAIVHACNIRHTNNDAYQQSIDAYNIYTRNSELLDVYGGLQPFVKGVYGSSEMFVNGFRYLIDSGVVKRKVYPDIETQLKANNGEVVDQAGVYMHGGFYLGPSDFYQWLRDLSQEQQDSICMTSVLNVNQLDTNFELLSAQRQHARFINSGLMATTNGAIVSDGLENGQVLSGVGGQYNFVAMAHKLPDARSILMIRATRTNSKGEVSSNILHKYGHITLPRHLRDVVITEYGIADLRSKSDEDVYKAMLNIADSRFQGELLEHAKQYGKINAEYVIPTEYSQNTPESIQRKLALVKRNVSFPLYPFGEEFTDEEEDLIVALQALKILSYDKIEFAKTSLSAWLSDPSNIETDSIRKAIERMGLAETDNFKDKLMSKLLTKLLTEYT